MYSSFLYRTQEAISALKKHIQTSDRFRTAVFDGTLKCASGTPCFDLALNSVKTAPDSLHWRIIDHCTAVTRIYAIYEQFTHEMIREHLSFLQDRLSFSELPDAIRSSYRLGIARILERKEGPRFADLDLAHLIAGYDRALAGENYTLEPRAMLIHEQNLRLPELQRLMKTCSIDNVEPWIEKHPAVEKFFNIEDRLTSSATKEMNELIKYRNDAAHGSIDISDILDSNGLIEFCDFISVVCEAISERVQLSGLNLIEKNDMIDNLGSIKELFRDNMIAIGSVLGFFKVGITVYICGETYCFERKIISLQLNDEQYDSLILTVTTELGMGFNAPVRNSAAIRMIKPLVRSGATIPNSAPAHQFLQQIACGASL